MSTDVPSAEVPIPSISSSQHLDPQSQQQTQRSVSVSSATGQGVSGVKNLKAIFEAKSDTSPSRERESFSRRTSEAGERRTSRVRASFVSVINAQDARDMAQAGKDGLVAMDLGMLLKGSPFAIDGSEKQTEKKEKSDKDKGIKIQTKPPRVSDGHAKPLKTPTTPVKASAVSSPRGTKPRSPAVEKGLFSPRRVTSGTSAKKVSQKSAAEQKKPDYEKQLIALEEMNRGTGVKLTFGAKESSENPLQADEPRDSKAQPTLPNQQETFEETEKDKDEVIAKSTSAKQNGPDPAKNSSSTSKPETEATKPRVQPKALSSTKSTTTSKPLPSAAFRSTASTNAKRLSTAPANTSRPESRSSLSQTRPPRASIAPINSRTKTTSTAPPSAAMSTKEKIHHPRASIARSELPNVQPAPTTKFIEGDFLARMTRPTASSASKVHTKVEANSPPRKLNGSHGSGGHKRASVLPAIAKKVEDVKELDDGEGKVKVEDEDGKPIEADVEGGAEIKREDVGEVSKGGEEVQTAS